MYSRQEWEAVSVPLAEGISERATLPLCVREEFEMAATLHDRHLMTPVTRISDLKRRFRSSATYLNQLPTLSMERKNRSSSSTSVRVAPSGATMTAPRCEVHSNVQPTSTPTPIGVTLSEGQRIQ